MIYICGDSFSSIDPMWKGYHWSERLSNKLNLEIKNLAFVSASNSSIAAQIEKAIGDKNCKFLIINASDCFRIDVPTKYYSREKVKKDTVESITTYKDLYNKIYTEVYKNKFTDQHMVLDEYNIDLYSANAYNIFNKFRKKSFVSYGMWNLVTSDIDVGIKQFVTQDVDAAALEYFKNLFDLNLKFHTDLSLIEGKLYKLKVKQIPFVYNLGGLTSKKSYHYKMFKEIIENIDNNQDLIHHKSEINFYDLDDNVATVSDKVPLFHIGSETIQEEIAEHYYKLYASQAIN